MAPLISKASRLQKKPIKQRKEKKKSHCKSKTTQKAAQTKACIKLKERLKPASEEEIFSKAA